MEKNLKLSMNALLLASAVFFTSTVALFFMRQAEVEKRVVLEEKVAMLDKEKIRVTKELDEVMLIKKDLETKAGDLQAKATLLEGQLDSERKAKDSASLQLETEKRESKRLVDELVKVKDERERLSISLASIKGESESLKMQLSSVQQAKEIMETKIRTLLAKNEVELEKIVVKPETAENINPEGAEVSRPTLAEGFPTAEAVDKTPAPAGESGAQGEILVVNKKFDFVVTNLGEQNGLRPGMDLGVYRDKKLLATLQVEKVHVNMSAAKIPPEWKNVELKEGDTVVVVK